MSICNVSDAKKKTTLHSPTSRKRQITSEKTLKTSQNGGSLCHALPPSNLLRKKTKQKNIYISVAFVLDYVFIPADVLLTVTKAGKYHIGK